MTGNVSVLTIKFYFCDCWGFKSNFLKKEKKSPIIRVYREFLIDFGIIDGGLEVMLIQNS